MNQLPVSWLKNGIIALAISGIYSIIIVLLRTPGLIGIFADKSIFQTALVIHVDFSVLVWLLSFTCIFWSYDNRINPGNIFPRLALMGMILMAISPFIADTNPVMNNYIPMLENFWFIIGLVFFGVAILCFAVISIIEAVLALKERIDTLNIVKATSASMFLLVWCCFILSYLQLEELIQIVPLDIDYYYEMLYWSGGHLMQFIYTQILMLVWLILFEVWTKEKLRLESLYCFLFILNFLLSLPVFYGHISYDIADGSFKEIYTLHMKYAGGIVPTIFIFSLCYERLIQQGQKVPKFVPAAIITSSLLFLSGGLIGVIISGVNVTIPAHYHGSIVGISIAFMGAAYLYCYGGKIKQMASSKPLIAKLFAFYDEDNNISKKEMNVAAWQIYILAVGQMIHILGLALAGGYGVLRKTPNAEIAISAKIYMGMVGVGGLLAIIGGLMFVYICIKRLYFIRG